MYKNKTIRKTDSLLANRISRHICIHLPPDVCKVISDARSILSTELV